MSGPAIIDGTSYYQFDICYAQYFNIDGTVYASIADYINFEIHNINYKRLLYAFESIVNQFNDYQEILFNSKERIEYPYAVDNCYSIILNAIRANLKGKKAEYKRELKKLSI